MSINLPVSDILRTEHMVILDVQVPQEFLNAGEYEIWMRQQHDESVLVTVYSQPTAREDVSGFAPATRHAIFAAIDHSEGWRKAMVFLTEDMPASLQNTQQEIELGVDA